MLLLLFVFIAPLALLVMIIWGLVRGSRNTRIVTGILSIILLGLLSIPFCKPLDLSEEDNNPVSGELQGTALQTYLERNSANGLNTHQWKKKNESWYECWSGATVLQKFYGIFYMWFFTEPEDMSQKVLIQTK